ncbi:hypothetical protein ISN76_04820 [Dyella halodurans]|uniref:Lipoprotein n=1 Tax=Dyella halodurans TaxID=1920171 RepID=A0ABV9C1F3_9GAMM|nr:hypothetical protein [Dyella halodurans]
MRINLLALGVATAIMLSACSSAADSGKASFVPAPTPSNGTVTSSTDANKINFAQAINASLGKECVEARVPVTPFGGNGPFPVSLSFALPNDAADKEQTERWNRHVSAPFEALVKVGLLAREEVRVKQPLGGMGPGRKYSLTNAGRDALLLPNSTVFCAGRYKVGEVVQFTEPSKVMGATVSEVGFTFAAVDVPAWASDDTVQTAFPNVARALHGSGEGQARLVLSGGHWEAELSLF